MEAIWFDLFVSSVVLLVGNLLFNRFEQNTPRWRRVVKSLLLIAGFTALAFFLDRWAVAVAWGVALVALFVVHGILLPKKGINGWTAEPEDKYAAFRGEAELFRNKKNGHLYRVLYRAKDCTNARDGTPVVVYRPLEGDGLVYTRDAVEFGEKFEAFEGKI